VLDPVGSASVDPAKVILVHRQDRDPRDNPAFVLDFIPDEKIPAALSTALQVNPWLKVEAWRTPLTQYPDQATASRLLHEMTHGADIRYTGPVDITHEWNSPLPSHEPGRSRLLATLRKEQLAGHFVGPFKRSQIPFENFIACPVYGVPKNDQFDRLIHDLTVRNSPDAINAHIDPTQFNIRLPRLRDTMAKIMDVREKHGSVFLWIEDASEAFHHVKLNRASRPLLMFRFDDRYYIRTTVSFGSRSSPGLWYEITEAFLFIIRQRYPHSFTNLQCYVDDFLGIGHDEVQERKNQLRFQVSANKLGIRLDRKKRCTPATVQISTGFQFDTVNMRVSIPAEKLKLIRSVGT
jgi:hypothetical protein